MDFQEKKVVVNRQITANVLSKLFFWWTFKMFKKGSKQDLTSDDLFDVLPEDHSGRLGKLLANAWDNECQVAREKSTRPRFYKALLKVFFTNYAKLGIFLMFDEWVLRVVQTIFLPLLISSLTDGSSTRLQYAYATGIILTTLMHTLFVHPSVFGMEHVGMKCRVACCSLIYRKALRLSKSAQGQTTVGKLVNLMSNDVNRFDVNLIFLHYLYIGPVQCSIFMYLLWTMGDLRLACLAGVGFILVLMPIQYHIGKLKALFRFQTANRTDKRGQVMNEIITAIRVVKMYGWEQPMSILVNQLRRLEIKVLRKTAYLRAFYHSLYISSSKMIAYLTILAYILSGGTLHSDTVFFMVTIYNIMQQVMVNFMPAAAAHAGELAVSMHRIEEFLLSDEKETTKSLQVFEPNLISNPNWSVSRKTQMINFEPTIEMSNVCASWTAERETLKDFKVEFNGHKLIMVIGPVGSGKSSFLHAIISELPLTSGKCVVKGKLSYASQEPWIFQGNLRQNILFGRPYDETLYRNVIHYSALEEDLKQLPFGEFTVVGERGCALSGGQKARINLARALYQQADINLLDDIMSSVDSRVGRQIFEKCVQRYLKNSLRILVTHQLQYLHQADYIIVLNLGKIMAQGTYTQLVDKGVDFVSLVAAEGEKEFFHRNGSMIKKDVEPKHFHSSEDKPEAQQEKMVGGSVTRATYWQYFKFGGSLVGMTMLALGFILSQVLYSAADYWISHWTSAAENYNCSIDVVDSNLEVVHRNLSENFLNLSSQTHSCEFDNNFYMYVYTGIVIMIFLVTKARATYFFQYCLNISSNIHDHMFSSLTRAPTQFFDENPSGRIMNRFTKDLGVLDELLPPAFFDALSMFLAMAGSLVVISMSNYYLIPPALVLVVTLLLIRRFYLKTARHVKRIEATSKSKFF